MIKKKLENILAMIEYFLHKIKIYLSRSAMQTNDLVKNSKCFGKKMHYGPIYSALFFSLLNFCFYLSFVAPN